MDFYVKINNSNRASGELNNSNRASGGLNNSQFSEGLNNRRNKYNLNYFYYI